MSIEKEATTHRQLSWLAGVAGWLFASIGLISFMTFIYAMNEPVTESVIKNALTTIFGAGGVGNVLILSVTCFAFAFFSIPMRTLLTEKHERLDMERVYRELPIILVNAFALYKNELGKGVSDTIAVVRLVEQLQKAFPQVHKEFLLLAADMVALAHEDIVPLAEKLETLSSAVARAELEAADGAIALDSIRTQLRDLAPRLRQVQESRGDIALEAKYLSDTLSEHQSALQPYFKKSETNVVPLHG